MWSLRRPNAAFTINGPALFLLIKMKKRFFLNRKVQHLIKHLSTESRTAHVSMCVVVLQGAKNIIQSFCCSGRYFKSILSRLREIQSAYVVGLTHFTLLAKQLLVSCLITKLYTDQLS